ncbi:MAG: dihydropteroate synthase [Bacteroidetes bacterium]|nr:dihydropteroate synthase [Bacteroidota bacterium]
MFTLNCKGKVLGLEKPVIMSIINITNDSFYKGFLNNDIEYILQLATGMIQEGASILDIGGQSTRPGSIPVSAQEEIARVLPVIEAIHQKFPDIIISIDTYYSEVAQAAVAAGAGIVNDISAGNLDANMIKTVARLRVPYVCMHMKGTPNNMQIQPHYKNIVTEILDFFIQKIDECKSAGITDIIIDPGFGFGKTISHNFELLKSLEVFTMLQLPILAGLSRKSTIYKTLDIDVSESLNGTTVLNSIALLNGANILRVHDVKEAKQTILLIDAYKNAAL